MNRFKLYLNDTNTENQKKLNITDGQAHPIR